MGVQRTYRLALACMMAAVVWSCASDSAGPAADADAELRSLALAAGLAPLPETPIRPLDNPLIAERVTLGQLLFFDPILSGPQDVACSTCHLPRFGFADARQFPSGAGATGLGPDRTDPTPPPLRLMPRNSPPVFNIGHYGRFALTPTTNGMMFWSGSAFGLEDQVLLPISADNELRGLTYSKVVAVDSVLLRLRSIPGYVTRFADAFPEIAVVWSSAPDRLITAQTLRLALAAYLRELTTPRAPIDAFLRGDVNALDAQQKQGLALFVGKAGCVKCHTGPVLSDFNLHVIGARQAGIGRDTTPGDDLGWGEHGGTSYAFRTAPLRQIALTAPYFHAGTAVTLSDVIRFKNAGRSDHVKVPGSRLDPAVAPLGLNENEMDAIVSFLYALTDSITVQEPNFAAPPTVPSGLRIPQ